MSFRGTTILAVRRGHNVVMGGDGQVTFNNTVIKANARKIRTISSGRILVGFAGATADAFTMYERFEKKLTEHGGNLLRAAVEMAKDWRTDRVLRRMEAMLVVADSQTTLLISGTGDVLEPEEGILAIGSGGPYARAAATALLAHTDLPARRIVEESLTIAAAICVFTNNQLVIEELSSHV